MIVEGVIDFLEHLQLSNKEVGTTSNIVASPPQLYSFVSPPQMQEVQEDPQ